MRETNTLRPTVLLILATCCGMLVPSLAGAQTTKHEYNPWVT